MQRRLRRLALRGGLVLAALAVAAAPVRAEEGGSGHYLPGFMGFQAGILPPERGFYFSNYAYFYDGVLAGQARIPVGGVVTAALRPRVFADTLSPTWVTGWKFLGADVGMNVTLPVVFLDVAARVTTPRQVVTRLQSLLSTGDLYFAPLMLGWHSGNSHWVFAAGIYAPTGEWELGSIAPTGKNFWTFEPLLGYTYLNPKCGWEFSMAASADFNTTNEATDYHSGTQVHLDWTIAKHLKMTMMVPAPPPAPPGPPRESARRRRGVPVAFLGRAGESTGQRESEPAGPGGAQPPPAPPAPPMMVAAKVPSGVALGIGGFFYHQVEGDSGSGAVLGPFKARSYGIGPQLQVQTKIGTFPIAFQFKVHREFNVQNRPEGYSAWFNAAFKL